jgi:V/A-type H+-transporting ATPase subunit D
MEPIATTRMELLARRARIALARQGRDLLREKRDALLKELRALLGAVLAGSDALERAAAASRRALGLAEALEGPESVRSAALAATGDALVDAGATLLMGVSLPDIRRRAIGRPRSGRGYSVAGTSARIDAVAERFEAEVDLILELAASELKLRRLAAEVGRTTRRVNALELAVIPRLEAERDRIEAALDEREREERFRLQKTKARRAARAGGP